MQGCAREMEHGRASLLEPNSKNTTAKHDVWIKVCFCGTYFMNLQRCGVWTEPDRNALCLCESCCVYSVSVSSEKSSTIGAKLLGVIKSTAIDCWSVQQHPKLQSQLCKTGNHGSIYHTQSTSWDTCLLKLLGTIRSFLRAGKIRSEGSRFLCHHFATWKFSKWILRESRRVNKVKIEFITQKRWVRITLRYYSILTFESVNIISQNQPFKWIHLAVLFIISAFLKIISWILMFCSLRVRGFKIVDNKSGTYVHLEFCDKISFV